VENNYKRGITQGEARTDAAREAADIPGRVIMVEKNRYNSDGL